MQASNPRNRHVVLGSRGPVGSTLIAQLVSRGQAVLAVSRNAAVPEHEDLQAAQVDLSDPASARRVCAAAGVVYMCAAPAYNQWPEKFPPLMRSVIEGASAAGAKLVLADNLYMYGPDAGVLIEGLPDRPAGRKGRTRAQIAHMLLEAHSAGKVRAAVGRASDFFGPGVARSALGARVFPKLLRGEAADVFGDPDLPHTYTYVPDFARALITLGEREEALGQVWHVPNAETLTTRRMIGLIAGEIGTEPKLRPVPKWMLRLMGLFNAEIRELLEVLYQFEQPHRVDHSKFAAAFGDASTPLEDAIRDTVEWFKARLSAERQPVTP